MPSSQAPETYFPHRPAWLVTIVTLVVFIVLDTFDWTLFKIFAADTEGWVQMAAYAALRYAPQIFAVLVVAGLLFGFSRAPAASGFNRLPFTGFVFALIVTSVMALTLALTAPLAPTEGLAIALVRGSLLPGFTEEVWYRAFVFGFLFRFAGWGFLPAALLNAAIFGSAHWYQSGDPGEAIAILAITASGGIWFSWLYVEWDYDVWVPASFHILMNAWWEIFAVSETALGPLAANMSRVAVIVLSVILTVLLARRRGGLKVRGRTWLFGEFRQ